MHCQPDRRQGSVDKLVSCVLKNIKMLPLFHTNLMPVSSFLLRCKKVKMLLAKRLLKDINLPSSLTTNGKL
jgi:hypothetical protein